MVAVLAAGAAATPKAAAAVDTCPNASLRTGLAAHLPDCRAYEKVSPDDKNGGDVVRDHINQYATIGAAESGDAVAYSSPLQFANIGSGSPWAQYRSRRGASGWTTLGISPPLEPDANTSGPLGPHVTYLSEDLERAVVRTNGEVVPGVTSLLNGSWGLFAQDNRGESSAYELLSRPFAPKVPDVNPTHRATRFQFVAATPDLDHVVFNSARQLTSDGPPDTEGAPNAVYEWANGEVRFVGKLRDGSAAAQSFGGARPVTNADHYPGDNAISDDGRRIFFMDASVNFPGYLYVREDGASTRLISRSERAGDDPNAPLRGQFEGAKASDGSIAFFVGSDDLLTDDSTGLGNLYRWDANAESGQSLTNLTPGDPAGGQVLATAGMTADASHVYFVARGDLADGATPGAPNLYLWREGAPLVHVATLSESDASVWSTSRFSSTPAHHRDARVSASGGRLLFVSRERLTAHDNAGHPQVYLYDAPTDAITCVSCGTLTQTSTAEAGLILLDIGPADDLRYPYRLPQNLSADGRRAFFESRERLIAGDTNDATDVYGWSEDRGLYLISSGQARQGSKFVGAGADGDDVFFTTRERLVPSDVDNQVDVYDARVGGGFPHQQVAPPCQGEACQGPAPAALEMLLPGSSTLIAPGDPPAAARRGLVVRRVTASQRRRFARTGRLTLTVRTPGAGRIVADSNRGPAATARVGRATTRRLTVSLSPKSRRALRRDGRLPVRLRVRFRDASHTVSFVLRRTK